MLLPYCKFAFLTVAAVALAMGQTAADSDFDTLDQYDVVICGGSTAALAAAFTAAEEGASVALLEPTDWIGGQFTASGVPAVDEAWHRITDPTSGEVLLDVARIARDPRNMTPFLRDALAQIGNPGRGWVSRYCFPPRQILDEAFLPREARLSGRLKVYRNTVIKSAEVDQKTGKVIAITAIQRSPRPGVPLAGYDRRLSEDLADWYSPKPSQRFDKQQLRFASAGDDDVIFIDATEWGELLALSQAPYLVAAESAERDEPSDRLCGQATTFGFVVRYNSSPAPEHPNYPTVPHLGFGSYRDKPDAWSRVWTYRRVYAVGDEPQSGDLSLQNWGYDPKTEESGNDYPYGYLLLSKENTEAQLGDWRGGVDLDTIAAAEKQAFAWHDWFRHASPPEMDPDCFTIDGEVLGTGHGLSKIPYVRDTRRSIAIDGFKIEFDDLCGPPAQRTGTRFADRVAIGAYAADIHPLSGCSYPAAEAADEPTLPYYIPYRALTNERYNNLMVAGKTMAQTFVANSAIRLHPPEWASGCAAGAAAAYLAKHELTVHEGLGSIEHIQAIVRKHTPIEWSLDDSEE